ncbi:hypothetical protein PG984_002548 [Apiospora sp. TS-2023a]
MWLINTQTFQLVFTPDIPSFGYAILSHTWEAEEVSFQEFQEFSITNKGLRFDRLLTRLIESKECLGIEQQGDTSHNNQITRGGIVFMNLECFDPIMKVFEDNHKRSMGIFLTRHQGVFVRSWPQTTFREGLVEKPLHGQMIMPREEEQSAIYASKMLTEQQSECIEEDLHEQIIVKLDGYDHRMRVDQVAPKSTWHPHQRSFQLRNENTNGCSCFWLLHVDPHPSFSSPEAIQFLVVCTLNLDQETGKQNVKSYVFIGVEGMFELSQNHVYKPICHIFNEKVAVDRFQEWLPQAVDGSEYYAGLTMDDSSVDVEISEPTLEDDGIFHIKIAVDYLEYRTPEFSMDPQFE